MFGATTSNDNLSTVTQTSTVTVTEKKPLAVIEKPEDFSKKKADIAKFFGANNNNNNSDKNSDTFTQTSSLTITETKPAKIIERSENFSKNKENIAKMFGGSSNSSSSSSGVGSVKNGSNHDKISSSSGVITTVTHISESITKTPTSFTSSSSTTYTENNSNSNTNSAAVSDDFSKKRENIAKLFGGGGGSKNVTPRIPESTAAATTTGNAISNKPLQPNSDFAKKKEEMAKFFAAGANNTNTSSSPPPPPVARTIGKIATAAALNLQFLGNQSSPPSSSSSSASNVASSSSSSSGSSSSSSAKFSKYSMMQKLKIPEPAIKQKMMSDGLSSSDIDLFISGNDDVNFSGNNNLTSGGDTGGGAISESMMKYEKMRKMKIPEAAIRQKMMSEGISSSDIESFLATPSSSDTPSATVTNAGSSSGSSNIITSTLTPPLAKAASATPSAGASDEIIDETGLFEKYIKMKKMRLPEGAIRQKMMSDGMNAADTSLFFDCLAKGNIITRNAGGVLTAGSAVKFTTPIITSSPSTSDEIIDETGLFEKYIKMKKMRLPEGAIRQKMMSDGMNAADTSLFFDCLANGNIITRNTGGVLTAGSTGQSTTPIITSSPSTSDEIIDETGLFEKYIKMKKMRLPEGAIRQKMMSDSMNAADTSLFFDCLAKGNIITRNAGTSSTSSVSSTPVAAVVVSTPMPVPLPLPVPVSEPEVYVDEAAEARKAMFKMKTFELVAPPKINLMGATAAPAPVVNVAAQLRKARVVTAETTATAAETKAITTPKVESVVSKWNDEANREAIQAMFKTTPFSLTPPPKIALPSIEKPKIELGEQLRQMRLARILAESKAVAIAAGIEPVADTTTATANTATTPVEEEETVPIVTSTALPVKRKLAKKRSIIGAPTMNALKFRSLLDEMALLLQAESDIKEVVDVAARDMTRDTDTGVNNDNKKTTAIAVSITDDPKLATYKKMRKMNMPELAIRQKMIFDGIAVEVIDALMKTPIERPVMINNEDADLQSGYRNAGGGGGSGNNVSFVYTEIYHFVENPIRTAIFKNEISVVAHERSQNIGAHIKDATDVVNAMATIRNSIMKRLSVIQLAQLEVQQQHQLKLAKTAQQAQQHRKHMNKLNKSYFVEKALGKSPTLQNRMKFQNSFHITPLSRLSETSLSNSSNISKPTYLYDKQTNTLLPSPSTRFQYEDWSTSLESSRLNDNDGSSSMSARSISSDSSAGRTSLSNFFKGIVGSPRSGGGSGISPRASTSIQQQQQQQQQQQRVNMSRHTGTAIGGNSYKSNTTGFTSQESSSKSSTNPAATITSPRTPMVMGIGSTDRVTSGLFPTSARLSGSQQPNGGNSSSNNSRRFSRTSSLSMEHDIGVQDTQQRNNAQYKLREVSPRSSTTQRSQQGQIPKRQSIFKTIFGLPKVQAPLKQQ